MERLKILFITKDQSQQLDKNSHYLANELKKQCELMYWTSGGHILKIMDQFQQRPDFILLNDCFEPPLCPIIDGLNEVRIPKGMIFHDISNKIQARKLYVVNAKIDYIFTHYRDAFIKWFPPLRSLMIWFPHHVNTNVFKDYNLGKSIDMLLMGAISPRLYPLRTYMLNTLKNSHGFVYYPHPGYDNEKRENSFVGKEYAMKINQAKIFFTCNSVYQYPLMKYFEVLASKTLLLAPLTKELNELGFKDGLNCVDINRTNFADKATYYLKNNEEREAIIQNGYDMVRNNHSTEIRVKQLLEKIRELITNHSY
ncbi:glycosyltransferase family protein [Metabacillus fastidiosus]|uniref:glycosyltransferase family protein n=1 Tax=Metabacillus fastidiosus TaxID=1458 RepID=UPI003D2A44CC